MIAVAIARGTHGDVPGLSSPGEAVMNDMSQLLSSMLRQNRAVDRERESVAGVAKTTL